MMSKSVFIIIFSSRHKQFVLLQKKRDAVIAIRDPLCGNVFALRGFIKQN